MPSDHLKDDEGDINKKDIIELSIGNAGDKT